ncbi:MAG: glycosyltransferase family 2 protein [Halanaerobiaceae bacterium]
MGEKISAVIPVYNSEASLPELYERLAKVLGDIGGNFEIIMVDDCSCDGSYRQILKLQRRDNRVKGIKLAQNFGQQNALICGFNYISGDYVVTLDDDLQHRPEDIIKLYEKIREGYDVVYGLPEERRSGFYRKIGSKLTHYLFNLITAKDPELRVSSFRIMTWNIVKNIIEDEAAFVYISALVLEETDNIASVRVSHRNRKYGKSNYSFLRLVGLFIRLYIYHGNLPLLRLLRSDSPQYIIEEMKGLE